MICLSGLLSIQVTPRHLRPDEKKIEGGDGEQKEVEEYHNGTR